MSEAQYLLAIESSCDETSAAVLDGTRVLSNIIASQTIHEKFGGVVPELASRAHQAKIYRVVLQALQEAGVDKKQLRAIGVTQGPGLMGSLHVGFSFAKAMAWGLGIPLIGVNHMKAHVLAHFAVDGQSETQPEFPFLCLTVSGGHTQLVLVHHVLHLEVIGETLDDAAGEAFDKAAKVLGLPYPGGPLIDQLSREGDDRAFQFKRPNTPGLSFSFSGLKTSLLYMLRDHLVPEPDFIEKRLKDICASYQRAIVDYLIYRLREATLRTGVKHIALAGGVSANSKLRKQTKLLAEELNVEAHIPPMVYCTDNAAMIGVAAYMQWQAGDFLAADAEPSARMIIQDRSA